MAHQHPPRFLKLVEDAKQRIRETNVDDVKARLDRRDNFVLIDVREDNEFDADHLPGAVHLAAFSMPYRFVTTSSMCGTERNSCSVRRY